MIYILIFNVGVVQQVPTAEAYLWTFPLLTLYKIAMFINGLLIIYVGVVQQVRQQIFQKLQVSPNDYS